MKYRIMIIDDEESGRTSLKLLLENIFYLNIDQINTSSSFQEAKDILANKKYDLIFLDIKLNQNSAFDLLYLIPSSSKVIFVTAYSEYLLKALRSKVFDYLLKPIKEIELSECLERCVKDQDLLGSPQTIQIKQHSLNRIIHIRDIVYIKGNGPYSYFHLNNQTISVSKTIKAIITEIGPSFIRIHKSYLVNKLYIKGFNKDKITLHNETCLPISRSGYKLLCTY